MLHLSACFDWCFPIPFPWARAPRMLWFGRLRPNPPIDREFCCICVNNRLKGLRGVLLLAQEMADLPRLSGLVASLSWTILVQLVFVCQRCFRLGFFGVFSFSGGAGIMKCPMSAFPMCTVSVFPRRIFPILLFCYGFSFFVPLFRECFWFFLCVFVPLVTPFSLSPPVSPMLSLLTVRVLKRGTWGLGMQVVGPSSRELYLGRPV